MKEGTPALNDYTSFIMSDYVLFMEAAGARVVPLVLGEDQDTTLEKLSKLNGVLFPGGDDDGYYDLGELIFETAKEFNDEGEFYPLWGICQGFENLAMYSADAGKDILTRREAHDISLTIDFLDDEVDQMFEELGAQKEAFEELAITLNSHSWSIVPESFETDAGLAAIFHPTSLSYTPDEEHLPFVATMESSKYPFFGSQFHPEKHLGEFLDGKGINHSWASEKLNRYFADKFMTLVRQNTNSFGTFSEIQAAIVENYNTVVQDDDYGMLYVFK
jgi:gamma-glutamyl hydrolase